MTVPSFARLLQHHLSKMSEQVVNKVMWRWSSVQDQHLSPVSPPQLLRWPYIYHTPIQHTAVTELETWEPWLFHSIISLLWVRVNGVKRGVMMCRDSAKHYSVSVCYIDLTWVSFARTSLDEVNHSLKEVYIVKLIDKLKRDLQNPIILMRLSPRQSCGDKVHSLCCILPVYIICTLFSTGFIACLFQCL